MNLEGLFNFTPAVLGIDPSSTAVGLCLMLGDGSVVQTWSVRAAGDPLLRLYKIWLGVGEVFEEIGNDQYNRNRIQGRKVEVWVEEGIYGGGKEPIPAMPRNAAMAGEVRGVILSLAWTQGWKVHKMYVASWKTLLSKEERAMTKNFEYVRYFNQAVGLEAKFPDEIDAFFIARRAVRGKT